MRLTAQGSARTKTEWKRRKFWAQTRRFLRQEQEQRLKVSQFLFNDVRQTIVAAKMLLHKYETRDPQKESRKIVEILDHAIAELGALAVEFSPSLNLGNGLKTALEGLGEYLLKKYRLKAQLHIDPQDCFLPREITNFLLGSLREILSILAEEIQVDHVQIEAKMETGRKFLLTMQFESQGFESDPLKRKELGPRLREICSWLMMLRGSYALKSFPRQGTVMTMSLPAQSIQHAPREKRGVGASLT